MSFRLEEKLNIDNNNLFIFKKWLYANNAKKIYDRRIISSIYFDNIRMDSYKDSNEGITPRKKIRLRSYNNNFDYKNKGQLEIKISSAEGRYKSIINKNNIDSILKLGLFDKDYGTCKPKIIVSYYRSYINVFNMRLTLDEKINYQKYGRNLTRLQDNSFIAEIKSDNVKNLNYIYDKFNFTRIKFSKYCRAIERLKLV
tara:strand:- start:72 stop:668 length:597 start_codon:yes stop_codon:yes gene_type:complete